jgi:hypothetical protein
LQAPPFRPWGTRWPVTGLCGLIGAADFPGGRVRATIGQGLRRVCVLTVRRTFVVRTDRVLEMLMSIDPLFNYIGQEILEFEQVIGQTTRADSRQ